MDQETKWIYGEIEESAFFAMLKMASETGKPPSKLVAEGLDLLLIKYAEKSENPSVKLHAFYAKSRARRMAADLVVQNAEEMSEIVTEQILGLCNLAGLTMDQVVEDLNKR